LTIARPVDRLPTMSGRDDGQDLHRSLDEYLAEHPDDVLVVEEPVDADQGVTAIVAELWAAGGTPMVLCRNVTGVGVPILTNAFASRPRVARFLGAEPPDLHRAFSNGMARSISPVVVDNGPVLDQVTEDVDLSTVPMLVHFEQDAAPYLTSAIVLAEDPQTGAGNLSYHRCMVRSPTSLATSLHSRGHLWRALAAAEERGEPLPVAVILGGHPLFMLAAAARVAMGVDERDIAGGLFGEPLEVVPTPRYGLGVPATADGVLEGVIDPTSRADEGPFGEYSGYASNRSTNNLIEVQTVMRRGDAMMLDVVSGNAADHLNLGRIPRESELVALIRARFTDVSAIEFPVSGTHFHCYVALRPGGQPQVARQALMAVLGMDPYVKMAVAVDDDVDIRRDEEVLWAVATRFQADRDLIVVPRLPGSMLDPSSDAGVTSRMALDATRGPGFEGERISLSDAAVARAREILGGQAPAR
jgi:2,5-furandicarboxylate decarboxylase 1